MSKSEEIFNNLSTVQFRALAKDMNNRTLEDVAELVIACTVKKYYGAMQRVTQFDEEKFKEGMKTLKL